MFDIVYCIKIIKFGVVIFHNSNANWWKGSNHRGEGLFPANFVTEDLEAKLEEETGNRIVIYFKQG